MVLEKLTDRLDEDVLLHALFQDLLHLGLVLRLEDRRFLLEEEAHAVERQDLEGFYADDPVQDQVKLLGGDVADEAVEHPRKYYFQRLYLQLFKLYHEFLLG